MIFKRLYIFLIIISCAEKSLNNKLNTIIGHVNFHTNSSEHFLNNYIGTLYFQDHKYCIATALKNNSVITAGHCVSGINLNDMSFYLKGRKWLLKSAVYFRFDDIEDIAILKVPGLTLERDLETDIYFFKSKILKNISLFSILNETLVSQENCEILNYSSNNKITNLFFHNCDTLPSFSGSPIFDSKTMKLVGIHKGGNFLFNLGSSLNNIDINENNN